MTNETKHTPGPWALDEYKSVVDEKGQTVLANGFSMVMSYGEDQKVAKANAAHIVKCVNMHDELVEALKLADGFLANKGYPADDPLVRGAINSALAKARGEV